MWFGGRRGRSPEANEKNNLPRQNILATISRFFLKQSHHLVIHCSALLYHENGNSLTLSEIQNQSTSHCFGVRESSSMRASCVCVCVCERERKREREREREKEREKEIEIYLPMSENSPTTPRRRMALRRPRTVIPSQKHTTTLALGSRSRSLRRSRSKLFSPALL